ncbi:hypothetical protein P8452_41847 [Trifolium repens]|nr:hypothetical protein P8452_41847 [Trifolium repens]
MRDCYWYFSFWSTWNWRWYDFLKAITLTLCCDNGTATTFCVALTDRTFKTTSVGLGWSDFCKANQFHIGDAIYFKFAESISSNRKVVCKKHLRFCRKLILKFISTKHSSKGGGEMRDSFMWNQQQPEKMTPEEM